jgi:hypothetical protein
LTGLIAVRLVKGEINNENEKNTELTVDHGFAAGNGSGLFRIEKRTGTG